MKLNRKIVAGAAAGLAVAGAGAAVAATELGGPREESQAIVNDAAKRLGVEPSALSDALKKALEDRVDAAVEAGRLTKAQGDAIKQRIEAGDVPLFLGPPMMGPFGGGFFGHFPGFDAAASYLGLTESELRSKLDSGKTLAQIAKDEGKSVDGLVQALVDEAKKHIDEAVKAGRLTQSQADQVLSEIKQRITHLVNNGFPGPRGGFPGGPGGSFGPPQGFRGFGPPQSSGSGTSLTGPPGI